MPTYIITATHPDGSPYYDQFDLGLAKAGLPLPANGSSVAEYSEDGRDRRIAAMKSHGLTPHVRTDA